MQNSWTTRPSLLVRIRDLKDRAAWGEFVAFYAPLVYAFAHKQGLQQADVLDVTQDVFQTLARKIGDFDYQPQQGRFRDWLYTIVRSRLADHMRREARSPGTNAQLALDLAEGRDEFARLWEQEYLHHAFHWSVVRIRDDFQPRTWRAFMLFGVHRLKASDVAAQLDMSVGAVYVAKSRVLTRMREVMSELEQDEE